jgi:hypothetical protein
LDGDSPTAKQEKKKRRIVHLVKKQFSKYDDLIEFDALNPNSLAIIA